MFSRQKPNTGRERCFCVFWLFKIKYYTTLTRKISLVVAPLFRARALLFKERNFSEMMFRAPVKEEQANNALVNLKCSELAASKQRRLGFKASTKC